MVKNIRNLLRCTLFFTFLCSFLSPLAVFASGAPSQKNAFTSGKNESLVKLFHPNYILPGYYTGGPDYAVYQGRTPGNQKINQLETKFQISLLIPLVYFDSGRFQINAAYTQQSYWQTYSKSQFFRESNYEPELFFEAKEGAHWIFNTGIVHQSNGRGGSMERSWNRVYIITITFL